MVRITNGNLTLTVPNSAYNTIYKECGFRPISAENMPDAGGVSLPTPDGKTPPEQDFAEENVKISDTLEPEPGNDEPDEPDLSEIPLSEMDFYQLQSYADQLGLDYEGIRSKKELRALIRNNT
jgi:hypothetical protein